MRAWPRAEPQSTCRHQCSVDGSAWTAPTMQRSTRTVIPALCRSWQRHHPGWRMRLWTGSKQVKRSAVPDGERSELLRREVILQFEGV